MENGFSIYICALFKIHGIVLHPIASNHMIIRRSVHEEIFFIYLNLATDKTYNQNKLISNFLIIKVAWILDEFQDFQKYLKQ